MEAAEKLAIALLMLIEYQSAEIVRPSTQCGVSTTPPLTVVDCSGCKFALPDVLKKMGTVLPECGSIASDPENVPGLNSSDRFGARISKDQLLRRRRSSLTWLVMPSFHDST